MNNPWLEISLSDYVDHMSSPDVRQYQMLNQLFKKAYTSSSPEKVLVLGISDGNGLEHVQNEITKELVGIDINRSYLGAAKEKFVRLESILTLVCDDITSFQYPERYFDLVHGALIFEYVDPEKVMPGIISTVKDNGLFSVVLQLPHDEIDKISKTQYSDLNKLAPIMNFVNVDKIRRMVHSFNFVSIASEIVRPSGDKRFHFEIFRRN